MLHIRKYIVKLVSDYFTSVYLNKQQCYRPFNYKSYYIIELNMILKTLADCREFMGSKVAWLFVGFRMNTLARS